MVDKSNEYGYVGPIPTQTNLVNSGIFEVNDVIDLLNAGDYTLQAHPFEVLNIAGAGGATGTFSGGSGNLGGGGGAGGYRNSYDTENSGGTTATETKVGVVIGQSYTVTVGGGGTGGGNNSGSGGQFDGYNGSDSVFGSHTATKGGGGVYNITSPFPNAGTVGSSGGALKTRTSYTPEQTLATPTQGTLGSPGNGSSGGGGGGAGTAGGFGSAGAGLSSSITGSAVTRASGGSPGGGGTNSGNSASANTGSGGNGSSYNSNAYGSRKGGNGGSGIVIIRYPNTFTITVGGGLTSSTTTDGTDKITTFTAGTDTVSWS